MKTQRNQKFFKKEFKSWAAISVALAFGFNYTVSIQSLSLIEGKQFEYVTSVYLNVSFM